MREGRYGRARYAETSLKQTRQRVRTKRQTSLRVLERDHSCHMSIASLAFVSPNPINAYGSSEVLRIITLCTTLLPLFIQAKAIFLDLNSEVSNLSRRAFTFPQM